MLGAPFSVSLGTAPYRLHANETNAPVHQDTGTRNEEATENENQAPGSLAI